MDETVLSGPCLQQIYVARFARRSVYRDRVWGVLCGFFARWIPVDAAVLDAGCGHCEFINSVACGQRLAMDLNPDAAVHAAPDVELLAQDCAAAWPLPEASLDVVFTSNFLEHLPTRAALRQVLEQAYRALRVDGQFIAMGPNIRFVGGAYWDFFDHHLPLTERSMAEVLTSCGFRVDVCHARFLPYTMSGGREYPVWMLRAYLAFRPLWRGFGRQFLIVASKPEPAASP